jgi:DNA-binding HxlR family transcriptional regulator
MNRPISSIINTLSRSKSLDILFTLRYGHKRWRELLEVVKDKKTLSNRIRELAGLGLIKVTFIFDTPTGTRIYMLTPTGKRILELLEEMERVYKEGVSLEERELKWVEEKLKKSENGKDNANQRRDR